MRIKARLRTIKFDVGAYRRRLHRHMVREAENAARAWLHEIFQETFRQGSIRVWSSASIETFRKLAAKVSFPIAASPKVTSRASMGRENSEGEIIAKKREGRYRFRYGTTLFHLSYNEFNNANNVGFKLTNPGPYNFQTLGQAAFRQYAKRVRLPNPFHNLGVKATTTIK